MTIVPASTGELRRVAEMSPRMIPTVLANSSAKTVSSTVTGRRSSRMSATGRPYRMELPKSPWTSDPA